MVKFIEAESRKGLPGAEGKGMESWCLMGPEFQFGKKKSILEKDGGDGCRAMRMHLMLLNT